MAYNKKTGTQWEKLTEDELKRELRARNLNTKTHVFDRSDVLVMRLRDDDTKEYTVNSLCDAALHGDQDRVKIISQQVDVNEKDEFGNTPLHYAASGGNTEVCALLIEKGSQVNAQNNKSWTPLHWAALNGRKPTVDFLLSKGAKTDIKDDGGWTVLALARNRNHTEIVKTIQEKEDSTEYKVDRLCHAAQSGNLAAVKTFSGKVDVNAKDRDGITALDHATRTGNQPIVEYLLSKGAKTGKTDEGSNTAEKENVLTKVWKDEDKKHLVDTCLQRTLVAGQTGYGKSSLVESLVRDVSFMKSMDDRTAVVDLHMLKLDDKTTATIYDLGGHDCYQVLAHLFITDSENNLALLAHQINQEKREDYLNTCQWITDIVYRSPKSSLLFVLTKADEVSDEEQIRLKKCFITEIAKFLEKEIAYLKPKKENKLVQSRYEDILHGIKTGEYIHIVSCRSKAGLTNLKDHLKSMINHKTIVPMPELAYQLYPKLGKLGIEGVEKRMLEYTESRDNDQSRSSFQKPEESLQKADLGRNLKKSDPVVPRHLPDNQNLKLASRGEQLDKSKDDSGKHLQYVEFKKAKKMFRDLVPENTSDEEIERQLKECLQVLASYGLIVWYSNPDLSDYIFNDIRSFVNTLKSLFVHDTDEEFSYEKLKEFILARDIVKSEHDKFVKDLEQGFLSVRLLGVLARKFGFDNQLDYLINLLEHLKIAFLIPEDSKENPEDDKKDDQKLFFPWYTKDIECPTEIQVDLSKLESQDPDFFDLHLVLGGRLPSPLFHFICIKCSQFIFPDSKKPSRYIFKNHFYASTDSVQMLLKHDNILDGTDIIHMKVRSDIAVKPIRSCWNFSQQVLDHVDKLKSSWWPQLMEDNYYECTDCNYHTDTGAYHWPVTEIKGSRGEPKYTTHCDAKKKIHFPTALIHPLPDDETKANECMKDIEQYLMEKKGQTISQGKVKGDLSTPMHVRPKEHQASQTQVCAESKASTTKQVRPKEQKASTKVSKLVKFWQDVESQHHTSEFLTDADLHDIAKKIGNEIEEIASRLKITNAEVEQIKRDHPWSAHNQNFHILLKWRDRTGPSADERYQMLRDCMNEIRRVELINLVEKIYNAYKEDKEGSG